MDKKKKTKKKTKKKQKKKQKTFFFLICDMFLNDISYCGNPKLTIICKMLDIVNTAKVGPNPKMCDIVYISD